MTLTLHHGEPNGPSLTVLAALHEVGAEAGLDAIDLAAGERHKLALGREAEMSIEGEGPVLVADGEAMADSVFLAQYLDEQYGGALQPSDPFARWEMEMWCRFIIERVAPGAALLGNRAHLTPKLKAMNDADFEALVGRIASADLAARWRVEREGAYPEAQIEDSREKIRLAVKTARGPARRPGMDIGTIHHRRPRKLRLARRRMVAIVPDAFENAPKTRAWLGRVKARPSVRKALAASRTNDPLQAWAPGPEINRWG